MKNPFLTGMFDERKQKEIIKVCAFVNLKSVCVWLNFGGLQGNL